MRIVAGQYGGRRLEVPKGRDIRPTSDKVRGAIFNALRSRGAVENARVLDAFCGTGALGLEALSQGAAHCTFLDKAKDSLALAKVNAQALGLLSPSLRGAQRRGNPAMQEGSLDCFPRLRGRGRNDEKDVEFLLKDSSKLGACPSDPFDLVFLDPPYNQDLVSAALTDLYEGNWLSSEAVIVIEAEKRWGGEIPPHYKIIDEKTYGDTKVIFLHYKQ